MKIVPTFFCPKPWESMAGNEAERFCKRCGKYVHNLEMLSVSERLVLLKTSTICGRYRVALRRPRVGVEEAYHRRLAKCGFAVAASATALLTLWQVSASSAERSGVHRYRAIAPNSDCDQEVPAELYEERETVLLGMIVLADDPTDDFMLPAQPKIDHVDVAIDAAVISPQPSIDFQTAELRSGEAAR
jgi:hypothetical protein